MTTRKTYAIGNMKQLIDLNGDTTNFEINFKVTSQQREPFDILVVDQATLDSNPDLTYKTADKGEIAGTLKHDKNLYQNYYLILKSSAPCSCDVEITKREIPQAVQQQAVVPPPRPQVVAPPTKNSFNWIRTLLIIGAVAIAGFALYYFSKKRDKKVAPSVPMQMEKPTFKSRKIYAPSASASSHSASPVKENPLLQRLKNLNIT